MIEKIAVCWWVELSCRRRRGLPAGLFYRRCPRLKQTERGLCPKHDRVWLGLESLGKVR